MKNTRALVAFVCALAFSGLSHANLVSYDVEYTGWWDAEGGGSLQGMLTAAEAASEDGIIDLATELEAWTWNWSGNTFLSAFSISSNDAGAGIDIFDTAGFYVDGTANLPDFADNLDQGVFIGGSVGEFVVDLEFLILEDNTTGFPFGGDFTEGDLSSAFGIVSVAQAQSVPVPTPLTLLAFAIPALLMSRKVAAPSSDTMR